MTVPFTFHIESLARYNNYIITFPPPSFSVRVREVVYLNTETVTVQPVHCSTKLNIFHIDFLSLETTYPPEWFRKPVSINIRRDSSGGETSVCFSRSDGGGEQLCCIKKNIIFTETDNAAGPQLREFNFNNKNLLISSKRRSRTWKKPMMKIYQK